MSKTKYYCFTLNNYNDNDIQRLRDANDNTRVSYIVFGREVGESGTPHLQGYIELNLRSTMGQVKSILGSRVHLEARRGTAEEASAYCKKDGEFEEFGTISSSAQGRRTDLESIVERVKEGSGIRAIATEFPGQFIRYHAGIERLVTILQRREMAPSFNGPYRWDVGEFQTLILWGASGIGKTEFAKYLLPNALFVTHLDDLRGFNPETYEGIIFDDMSFVHIHREAQIHLVDYDNPRSIHIRYGTANIPAGTKKIFLTNNHGGHCVSIEDPAIRRRVAIMHLE